MVIKYGMYLHIHAPNAARLWTTQSKEMYLAIYLEGHFECRQQNDCVHEKPLLYFVSWNINNMVLM